MIELRVDLWTLHRCMPICITTNGSFTKHGLAVMGRGCAREAKERFPALPARLGARLRQSGNRVYWWPDLRLVTYPVKHRWYERADLELIRRSALELLELAAGAGWRTVALPRPGCGNGGRSWESEVRPLLSELLDDRFLIVTRP